MSLEKLIAKAKDFELPKEIIDSREAGRLEFISLFPLDQISSLTLDQYADGVNKNSFCYWLEFKKILFGVGGGTASKFGLYKAKDGNYYGGSGNVKKLLLDNELQTYFITIKEGILEALRLAKEDRISEIRKIDSPVWNMILQKILSIYYPEKFITIGAPDVLIECARDIGLSGIELAPENSIQINYECKKKLSAHEFFRDWPYEKIGSLVWSIYKQDSKRDYFIIGSKYGPNNDEDRFPEMLKKSVASTDFAVGLNLTEYYGKNHSEITNYLKEKGQARNCYNALKHFLGMKVGDQVAIKASGSPKGNKGFLSIVGIAEVIEKDGNIYEYDPNGLGHVINVKYLKAPVYKEFELGGYGSTIHKLSSPDTIDKIFKGEYEVQSGTNNSFQEILNGFIQADLNTYFTFLRNILRTNNLKKGDDRLVFSCSSGKLSFTIGQRYCWTLRKPNNKGIFGVISKDKQLPTSESFEGNGPQPFYSYYNDVAFNQKDIASIFSAIDDELKRSQKSGFRKANNADFENYIFEKDFLNNNYKRMEISLNTILYGPPGTGKTYNSINKAISIVNRYFHLTQERDKVKAEFDRLVKGGQIVFTTFHQSMSYEDFIEGIKPIEPKIEGQPVIYKVIPGILKALCEKIERVEKLTGSDLPQGQRITNFDQLHAAFIVRLKEIISELEENETHFFESRNSKVKLISIDKDTILTIGEKASTPEKVTKDKLERIYNKFKSPDEIKDIVKQLREVGGDIGWTTNYFAVFKALKEFETSITGNAQENISNTTRQKYVLIIDEINRGNVSQIFGELITLIEEDKRLGKEEALEAILPYSKEKFGVPPNLYIIGTMNTADRSVEALDAALRRRFSFEEIRPNSLLIATEGKLKSTNGIIGKNNLPALLNTLNKRIEKLLDKDHQIGHSYFMSVSNLEELKAAFQNKIIPLLQEYFFGDFGKIGLVLGKGFFEPTEIIEENLFADFDDYDSSEFAERIIYKFKDISKMSDVEFNSALQLLNGK